MKRVLFFLVCIMCTLFVAQTPAEVDFPCDVDQGTVVVFGNGMSNDPEVARDSKRELERQLREYLSTRDQERLSFEMAYNNTHGKISDFLEAARQNNLENREKRLREIYGLEESPPESSVIKIYPNSTDENIVSDGDLTRHLAFYREMINEKKKRVVTVCHSQGNFFCNAAWRILNETPGTEHLSSNSFRPVGVANPSSMVAGNGYNITRDDDRIINAVRVAARISGLDQPMPATIAGDIATNDSLRHRFKETYLNPSSLARMDVLMDTTATIDSTEWPAYTPPASCTPPEQPIPEPVTPHCSDGLDNDGDGKIDWDGGPDTDDDGLPDGIPDPGCTGPTDTNEFNIIRIGGG